MCVDKQEIVTMLQIFPKIRSVYQQNVDFFGSAGEFEVQFYSVIFFLQRENHQETGHPKDEIAKVQIQRHMWTEFSFGT